MAVLITTRNLLPIRDKELMTKNYVDGRDKKWYEIQAERKEKALKDNRIDIFFEDDPGVVMCLRKSCPNTKIVQYGGRF